MSLRDVLGLLELSERSIPRAEAKDKGKYRLHDPKLCQKVTADVLELLCSL